MISRCISIVFLLAMTPSSNGTKKSRQSSRIHCWKMQGECMPFSYMQNNINLTSPCSRFRLVSLQVDELQYCHSQDDLENQLEDLPRNLDEVYKRIISGIHEK